MRPIARRWSGWWTQSRRRTSDPLGEKDRLAFYVNAYNAWILREALAKYPTKSVKDLLFTFFTGKRIKVAGQQTSFDKLGEGDDPRKVRRGAHSLRAQLRQPQLPALAAGGVPRRSVGRAV